MGIYWCAVDRNKKQRIEPPKNFSITVPGIYHPNNPFPNIVMMKNCQGYNFEMINDMRYDEAFCDEYELVTEKVYLEYLSTFEWAKEYYEPKDV